MKKGNLDSSAVFSDAQRCYVCKARQTVAKKLLEQVQNP